MRRPNYKVFIYDHNGRHFETVKVWAVHAARAVEKAKEKMSEWKKDPIFYTFVAREENNHVS